MKVIDVPVLSCFRCGHAWRPARPVVRICPRCKSKLWDVPKVRRSQGGRMGLGMEEVIGGRRPKLLKIAKAFGATNLRVFGSVSRGQASEKSDLDLLVTFRNGTDLFDLIHLERKLSHLLRRKVEVATEAGLDPEILAQALSEAQPI